MNSTRPIEDFVERLSNWYVRLSRDRFWKSESRPKQIVRLRDALRDLDNGGEAVGADDALSQRRNVPQSWSPSSDQALNRIASTWRNGPKFKMRLLDQRGSSLEEMALVRRLVSLGLSARNARRRWASVSHWQARSLPCAMSRRTAIVERYADLIQVVS